MVPALILGRHPVVAYAWTNFGGDKVWPNQQSEFEAINGRAWPPDEAFDGGVHSVDLLSPWVPLAVGETLDFFIEWELYRIPE